MVLLAMISRILLKKLFQKDFNASKGKLGNMQKSPSYPIETNRVNSQGATAFVYGPSNKK